mmetsp:Transcript_5588/g.14153  ORF Transcript_5588/g.14153 Transcript_5588/m.14153 type:complete len:469 (-) Transcript_5588:164-1570(-)
MAPRSQRSSSFPLNKTTTPQISSMSLTLAALLMPLVFKTTSTRRFPCLQRLQHTSKSSTSLPLLKLLDDLSAGPQERNSLKYFLTILMELSFVNGLSKSKTLMKLLKTLMNKPPLFAVSFSRDATTMTNWITCVISANLQSLLRLNFPAAFLLWKMHFSTYRMLLNPRTVGSLMLTNVDSSTMQCLQPGVPNTAGLDVATAMTLSKTCANTLTTVMKTILPRIPHATKTNLPMIPISPIAINAMEMAMATVTIVTIAVVAMATTTTETTNLDADPMVTTIPTATMVAETTMAMVVAFRTAINALCILTPITRGANVVPMPLLETTTPMAIKAVAMTIVVVPTTMIMATIAVNPMFTSATTIATLAVSAATTIPIPTKAATKATSLTLSQATILLNPSPSFSMVVFKTSWKTPALTMIPCLISCLVLWFTLATILILTMTMMMMPSTPMMLPMTIQRQPPLLNQPSAKL